MTLRADQLQLKADVRAAFAADHVVSTRRLTMNNAITLVMRIGLSVQGINSERLEQVQRDDADPVAAASRFHLTQFAREWVYAGCPRVVMGHKHAAALMATNSNPAAMGVVRLPWKAFWITVPDGLLEIDHETGTKQITSVTVLGDDDGSVLLQFGDANGLYFTALLLDLGASAELRRESHVAELVTRLFLGVTLELTEHREATTVATGALSVKRNRRGEPECRTFQLVRDVKVDCRGAIRDYCRGGGSAPTVQSLVRGHWKRQAHGLGMSDRKLIFVEPYWRGPEDAPIALRVHVLPKPEEPPK